MPLTALNGVAIHHESVGQGPPCLVMHGGLGIDHAYLRPWLDPLGSHLRLIYYDHRGNGKSAAVPGHAMTHAWLAADADALCAHLGLNRVAVIGHSYGGFIALEFALRHASRVSQLVLIDTAAAWPSPEVIEARARNLGASDAMMALWHSGADLDDRGLRERYLGLLPLYFAQWNEALTRHLFDACIVRAAGRTSLAVRQAYDVTARLQEIGVPTLIIAGNEDFICGPDQARVLRDGIGPSELSILAHCGHFPFAEQPGAFMVTLTGWISRLRSHERGGGAQQTVQRHA